MTRLFSECYYPNQRVARALEAFRKLSRQLDVMRRPYVAHHLLHNELVDQPKWSWNPAKFFVYLRAAIFSRSFLLRDARRTKRKRDYSRSNSCFKHHVTPIFIVCLLAQFFFPKEYLCDVLMFQSQSSVTQIYHLGTALRVLTRNSWSILFQLACNLPLALMGSIGLNDFYAA